MLKITAKLPDGKIKEEEYGEAIVRVGRGAQADLVLPDARASKLHAEIMVQDGKVFIIDLKSSNGTVVNGALIKDNTELHSDDEVRIGHSELFVELTEDDEILERPEENDTVNEFMFEGFPRDTPLETGRGDDEDDDVPMITQDMLLGSTIEDSSFHKLPESEILKVNFDQYETPETQPLPPARKVSDLVDNQATLILKKRKSATMETVDTAPPDAPMEHEVTKAEQLVIERLIDTAKRTLSPKTLTVGFVDPVTHVLIAPLILSNEETAIPQPPRVELLKKSIETRQGVLAEITIGPRLKITAFCIPLVGRAGALGFIYATRDYTKDTLATDLLRDAMTQTTGMAELLELGHAMGSAPGPGTRRPEAAPVYDVSAHIKWHIGECKRSLFMMASGMNQNNLAHVNVGFDRLKRLQYFYESLARTLEYVEKGGEYPTAKCDLRQIARVASNAVTEIGADHFITIACKSPETPLPVMVNRELLESILCGLNVFAIMNAREGDTILLEAKSPDRGETAWFQVSLPLSLAASHSRLEREMHLVALERVAGEWMGALESAPDANTYIIRISFPCVKG